MIDAINGLAETLGVPGFIILVFLLLGFLLVPLYLVYRRQPVPIGIQTETTVWKRRDRGFLPEITVVTVALILLLLVLKEVFPGVIAVVYDLGTPGLILLPCLLLLFLVTRLPWWVAQVCVPNMPVVLSVQAAAPGWKGRAKEWMRLPDISVWGFLASVLWPLTVGLNLLLLAQVLEKFFPGGTRVIIPMMGSYAWPSLFVGALFSITQTVFSVVAHQAGSEKKKLASLFVVLLLATIAAEVGLAAHRAIEIEKGIQILAPTAMDKTFSQGVVLTMFISFIVPVAHSVLGFIGVPQFVAPLVGCVPRFLAGFLFYALTVFTQMFFGFQKILPEAIRRAQAEEREAAMAAHRVLVEVEAYDRTADRMRETEKQWRDVQAETQKTLQNVMGLPKGWRAEMATVTSMLVSDHTQDDHFSVLDQRIEAIYVEVSGATRRERRKAQQLIARVRLLESESMTWEAALTTLAPGLSRCQEALKDATAALDAVAKLSARCRSILAPAAGAVPDQPTDPAILELNRLHDESMRSSDRGRQIHAAFMHARCIKALGAVDAGLRKIREQLTPLDTQVALLQYKVEGLSKNRPIAPNPDELKRVESQLRQCQEEAKQGYKEFKAVVGRLVIRLRDYSQKAGEEARGPKKRFWLWRFFDWIWQGWMGFIDVIVRSQPVPEPPPAETTCPEPPQAEVPRVSRAWTSASGAPVLVVASSLDSHRPSAAVKEEIQ